MDGLNLLQEACAAGLTVTREEDRIKIRGPRRAETIARKLLEAKLILLPLIPSACDTALETITEPASLPPEWHLLWDERAAIREYDGSLPRERAEAEALKEIIELMRRATDLARR